MVVEGLSCSCSCLAMWFLNPVLEVAESCSCSCRTHRYCRTRGIGCWNRAWSSSLFRERYCYPRAQVVPHPPSFRLQGMVRVIDPCWTQCSGAVPCNGNGYSSSASEAVQSSQRDATLHEMTTNSTKVGTENTDILSHCWRPSSYNQIKFACWFQIQNTLRIQILWQKYGTHTCHSTAVTASFCHPSNVGETQGLRDALQEVKDASIISCRVHRSVTEGITTNLSSYSPWKVPMEM